MSVFIAARTTTKWCLVILNDGTVFVSVVINLDIDDCAEKPCRNDGVCVDQVNDYRCDCESGYEGKDCETGKVFITVCVRMRLE